jgi:hypothetical protein
LDKKIYKQVNDTIKISNLTPNYENLIKVIYNTNDTSYYVTKNKEYNLFLDKIGKYEISIFTKHHCVTNSVIIQKAIEPLELLPSKINKLTTTKITHNFTLHPNIKKTIYNYNKEEKEEKHNSSLTTKNPHQLVEKFYNIKKQIKSNKKLAKQLVKNSTEYNQMLSNIEKLKEEQKDIEQKYYEMTNYSIYQHDKYLQTH